jgi:hypothetical protein
LGRQDGRFDKQEEDGMPKGEQRGNRETKKPKKEKAKTIAAAPSTKGAASAAIETRSDRNR